MRRRAVTTFSLSFLDCISCGLGAVILLFVIVNAKSGVQRDEVTTQLRSEVNRLETEVLIAKKEMIAARNALEETTDKLAEVQGLSQQVIEIVRRRKIELAESDKDTLAQKADINKLKADLKSIEEELRRLRAGAKTRDEGGTKLRRFPGTGDRHYLTDLKMGGRHIYILVDASASMLDERIVGIIRRRNLSVVEKSSASKWQRVVATVDWLSTQIPVTSKFQIAAFNEKPSALIEGTMGTWLDASNIDQLNASIDGLRRIFPQKGTSLINALTTIGELQPAPDNLFLLTDSLPTMGAAKPWRKRVSGQKRLRLFNEAIRKIPRNMPVNIILFPMEGDPLAASAYWRLALDSGGSFLCPAADWP